jgi:hypothetical protein
VDSNGDRAVRAPLYPAILSQLARLPGWIWLAHLGGALLGTLVVYLGYRLALFIVPDTSSAVIAALLLAVHPGLAIYAGLLQTETLYTVFLLSLMLVVFRFPQDSGLSRGVMAGVLAGLAGLTRTVAVGFFPLLLLSVLWAGRDNLRRLVLPLGVALLFWCLTLAPWTVRNYRMFGAFVPVTSGGGSSLLLGNNPYASGGLRVAAGFEQWHAGQLAQQGGGGRNEVEYAAVNGRIALEHMTADPGGTLLLALKKSHIYWVYPAVHTDSDSRVQLPAVGMDLILALGAAVGFVLLRPPRRIAFPAVAVLVFFWLVQAVLHSEARFRLPVVPFIAAYSGAGLLALSNPRLLVQGGGKRTIALGAAVLCVLAVYGLTAWMFLSGRL